MVECVVLDEKTPCLTLDAFLLVAPVDGLPAMRTHAYDADRNDLVGTEHEAADKATAVAPAGGRGAIRRRGADL